MSTIQSINPKITDLTQLIFMLLNIKNLYQKKYHEKNKISPHATLEMQLNALDLSTNESIIDFNPPTNLGFKDLKTTLDEIWYERLDLMKEKVSIYRKE